MVASRGQHGGHHLQHRHAQFGDRPGAPTGRFRQLGLVGLPSDGHGDGLCVCPALETFRGADRHQFLRVALWWKVCGIFEGIQGIVFGAGVQRLGHGDREFGGDQAWGHSVGLAGVVDPFGDVHNHLGLQCTWWTSGGDPHGLCPVFLGDGRFSVGRLVDFGPARNRWS